MWAAQLSRLGGSERLARRVLPRATASFWILMSRLLEGSSASGGLPGFRYPRKLTPPEAPKSPFEDAASYANSGMKITPKGVFGQ